MNSETPPNNRRLLGRQNVSNNEARGHLGWNHRLEFPGNASWLAKLDSVQNDCLTPGHMYRRRPAR